jgi:hypothetical protein
MGSVLVILFRVPTWEEVNDTSQLHVYHVEMTSNVPSWEPHSLGYNIQEGKLRTQLQLGIDLYQQQSRTLYPLQVRGPDQVDDDNGFSLPYEEDLESVDTAEHVPNDFNVLEGGHKVAAIRETGGSFSGDKDSTMQPRLQSRTIASVYQVQKEQADRYLDHHGALDVDSYAEALLDELRVTENYMDSLAHRLAANVTNRKRKGFVGAEKLAQNWGIGKEAARRTLESTTQAAVRDFKHTRGGRKLKPNAWMLRYPRRDTKVYTDTWFARVKSLRGNKCAQVYCTDFHFVKAVPMESKKDASSRKCLGCFSLLP